MLAFVSSAHAFPSLRRSLPASGARRRPAKPHPVTMRVMRFRPCIDIHDGQVKQIVGGTLTDDKSSPQTNFETDLSPAYYASLYQRDDLPGGHVIMLGPGNERPARRALEAYPGGMHIGGGIKPDNAAPYLDAGASHVIVTSYVFTGGEICWERVEEMVRAVGKQRLVLDVSCRKRDGQYVVCTDRWQKWTDFALDARNFERLGNRCDEILVHAVDVEGKKCGVDFELVELLAQWATVPVTYAGGVRSLADMDEAKHVGRGLVDVTIGSALDLFGGNIRYDDAVAWQRSQQVSSRT